MSGWSLKRIQHEAHKRAWAGFGDDSTYHPLRDGKRLYKAVWVVQRMADYLQPEQIAMAVRLTLLHARSKVGSIASLGEFIGYYAKGFDELAMAINQLESGEASRILEGFERAAHTRVGTDGKRCFHGIIEGDGQVEMIRRVGYPEGSVRSARKLVQLTLTRLQEYADENAIDLANWNRAA